MVWPEVEGEFRRLRARPTVIAAALTALGIGGGVLARCSCGARSRSSEALKASAVAAGPAG